MLPALAAGVPVWAIVDDLNADAVLAGRLLRPQTSGPANAPTDVRWPTVDLVALAEAEGPHADALLVEKERLVLALKQAQTLLQLPKYLAFARTLRLPGLKTKNWYYAPKEKRLVVSGWGLAQTDDPHELSALIAALEAELPRKHSEVEASASPTVRARSTGARGKTSLLVGALMLALLAAFAWVLWNRMQTPTAANPSAFTSATAPAPLSTPTPAATPTAPALVDDPNAAVRLANGKLELRAPVEFAVGSAELTAASRAAIAEVADFLSRHPEPASVRIEGHADPSGSPDKNFVLSTARVLAVKHALVLRGVDEKRLLIDAHGDKLPRKDDAGPQNDRRVEFWVK
jgi:outer membrane protein OmpA-like peptidoglycan-associated protein